MPVTTILTYRRLYEGLYRGLFGIGVYTRKCGNITIELVKTGLAIVPCFLTIFQQLGLISLNCQLLLIIAHIFTYVTGSGKRDIFAHMINL